MRDNVVYPIDIWSWSFDALYLYLNLFMDEFSILFIVIGNNINDKVK